MKLIRRTFLSSATAAIASSAMPEMTYAQSYPAKPVRILVGFPANGPNSILAGLAAEWLSAWARAGASHLVLRFAGDHARHLDAIARLRASITA